MKLKTAQRITLVLCLCMYIIGDGHDVPLGVSTNACPHRFIGLSQTTGLGPTNPPLTDVTSAWAKRTPTPLNPFPVSSADERAASDMQCPSSLRRTS